VQPSVTLVTPDAAMIDAAMHDQARLAARLECELADGWVSFERVLPPTRDALAADPGFARWGPRLFLAGDPRTLVGWGGFKGPPREGAVELGYEVAPGWRGRGLATAAVAAMLVDAFADPRVEAVLAHTLAEPGPSVRVLEKSGFARTGEVSDVEGGTLWRFRLRRSDGTDEQQ